MTVLRSLKIAALATCLFGPAAGAHATILTFDISGGVSNGIAVPQGYGDNVTMSPQSGHSYGVGAEGFTPNVTVSYGSLGERPDLWTTGYGDLTNVLYNEIDGDQTLTVTFTAAAGFNVTLFDFDMASFTGNPVVPGITVRDTDTNNLLFSLGATVVPGTGHTSITPNATARELALVINLTGLGGTSDNVGLDNLRFGQSVVSTIPEPATLGILSLGLGGLLALRRRRRSARG